MSTVKPISINATSIETGLLAIYRCLIKKYGLEVAGADMAPLYWYVYTCRAPIDFLRSLLEAKPFMIARKLHASGSYEEALTRVKKHIKWEDML